MDPASDPERRRAVARLRVGTADYCPYSRTPGGKTHSFHIWPYKEAEGYPVQCEGCGYIKGYVEE